MKFLGVFFNLNRIYIAKRTKGNFYNAIQKQNKVLEKNDLTQEDINKFLSSMNSYLGIMKHYKTFRLRKNILEKTLSPFWINYVFLDRKVEKFCFERLVKKKAFSYY